MACTTFEKTSLHGLFITRVQNVYWKACDIIWLMMENQTEKKKINHKDMTQIDLGIHGHKYTEYRPCHIKKQVCGASPA